jgi:hypothetical protein
LGRRQVALRVDLQTLLSAISCINFALISVKCGYPLILVPRNFITI